MSPYGWFPACLIEKSNVDIFCLWISFLFSNVNRLIKVTVPFLVPTFPLNLNPTELEFVIHVPLSTWISILPKRDKSKISRKWTHLKVKKYCLLCPACGGFGHTSPTDGLCAPPWSLNVPTRPVFWVRRPDVEPRESRFDWDQSLRGPDAVTWLTLRFPEAWDCAPFARL